MRSKPSAILTRLIHERIIEIAPEEYDKCLALTKPMIADVAHIPVVVEILKTEHPIEGEGAVFVIAVIHRIFSPYKNHYQSLKLDSGVRDIISQALGFKNSEMTNHHAKYIIPAYKGERYRQRVEDTANDIIKQLKLN